MQPTAAGERPPSYTAAVSASPNLAPDGSHDAPPSYDEIAYAWAYRGNESAPVYHHDGEPLPDTADLEQAKELSRRTAWFALLLLLGNVGVLIFSVATNRKVGFYFITNIISLLIFCVGATLFFEMRPKTKIVITQLYFLLLWLLTFGGILMFLYYTITIRDRLQGFCNRHASMCNYTNGTIAAAVICAILATVAFTLVFTYMARVAFICVCAVERAHFNTDATVGAKLMYRPVHFLGRFLPSYARHTRNAFDGCRCCEGCNESCDCCDALCTGLGNCCSCFGHCTQDAFVLWGVGCMSVCCCIGVVLCVAATGGWQQLGCFILEIIIDMVGK